MPQLRGHEVFALRRSGSGESDGINWISADLSEPLKPETLPEKIDAVIHLAQSPEYRNLPDGAPHVFRVNTASTAELLEYARKASAEHFLYASTGSVYEPFTGSMLEDQLVSPKNFYPASKLAGEAVCRGYNDHFAVALARIFFLYGPGQEQMLIARLVEGVLNGVPATLPEDGPGISLTPTYVDDCGRFFVEALAQKTDGIVNVAGPQPATIEDIIRTVESAAGKQAVIQRSGKQPGLEMTPPADKFHAMCRKDSLVTLSEGIRRTVDAARQA
ncbi:NAD-dependent epimerase/dehydratase family protein [Hyphobacterium sp.]|uniref:NAD-dependent epimerase/dehydratase family protein n=1 Tax=Hyphobacterium sp. TaxID=2004662 RepID=UPI003BADB544